MPNKHPLDLRIEIASLYDRGHLTSECTLDDIMARTGGTSTQTRNAIRELNFTEIKPRTPDIVDTLWERPRRFPKLSKKHRRVTHAIKDLYTSKKVRGTCYVADLVCHPVVADADEEVVRRALRVLGFRVAKRRHRRKGSWAPAVYAPPPKWPPLFERQRMLRTDFKPATIMRMTDAAARVDGILAKAVRELDVKGIPLYKKGALQKEIQEVIEGLYNISVADYVPRLELVKAMDASVYDGRDKLLADITLLRHQLAQHAREETRLGHVEEAERKALEEMARLDSGVLNECIKIMARRISTKEGIPPAAFALRWVRENVGVAGGQP